MFPLEFRGEVNHEETRVMGLLWWKLYDANFNRFWLIPLMWQTDWQTDMRTDRQTDDNNNFKKLIIIIIIIINLNHEIIQINPFIRSFCTQYKRLLTWYCCPLSACLYVCLWRCALWLNDTSYTVHQKCLHKYIGDVPPGTRFYNFQPPTPTPRAQKLRRVRMEWNSLWKSCIKSKGTKNKLVATVDKQLVRSAFSQQQLGVLLLYRDVILTID